VFGPNGNYFRRSSNTLEHYYFSSQWKTILKKRRKRRKLSDPKTVRSIYPLLVSCLLISLILDWSSKKELAYPPFCVDNKDGYLVVAGGGGESKTGIPNELVSLKQLCIVHNVITSIFSLILHKGNYLNFLGNILLSLVRLTRILFSHFIKLKAI
jgi:hypothetical protein